MSIAENVKKVQENMAQAAQTHGRKPEEIQLVAATKTQSTEVLREVISAGVTICGENRVQEMTEHIKKNGYQGARLDFIGHLQSNKVKQVVGQVALIHSVGSLRLLEEIGKEATKRGIIQDILLEINGEKEESKTGFFVEDIDKLYDILPKVSGINVRGLMAIPPRMKNEVEQGKIFKKLYNLYIDFSGKMVDNYKEIDCLSMGMSEDYHLAIAEGSTLVRVGTALFGQRS